MSEKRVIKLPAAVKKQLEVALASGSTWEFTSLMQRIRNAARKAAPGDAGYIADPEAAILHAVKIRGAQITPRFFAEHILPFESAKSLKKLLPMVLGERTIAQYDPNNELMAAALLRKKHEIGKEGNTFCVVNDVDLDVVKLLLAMGAPKEVSSDRFYGRNLSQKVSLLEFSVMTDCFTPELGKLLAKAGVGANKDNTQGVLGWTGSFKRPVSGDAVRALMAAGYDFQPTKGVKPISSYSSYSSYSANGASRSEFHPLSHLIEHGAFEAAEVLIRQGKIDAGHAVSGGRTALHVAAEKGAVEVVKALVAKRGVDLKAVDGNGMTPLFYAISARSPGAVAAILERSPALAKSTATIRRPKVEVLSHHGVYVSSEKDAKRTGPLDFAKMVLAVDRELVQKTPKYPDIGETAYNDEYYYTLRGGEEVPVEVIEKEHRAYLQKLDRHVLDTGLIVRQITDVQAKATASAGKAKKAAPRLGV